ncbi:hypothetical protein CG709_00180, partial [Lachnotalea glycerini]
VLEKELEKCDIENYENEVIKMENYIRTKGSVSIGPLIQYVNGSVNEKGKIEAKISILRQSKNFINTVEPPYKLKSVLRVVNCLYVRFIGEESKIKFAYDKINLTAFEEDIPLKGNSYTIFVDQQDDQIIADIFMERADNDETN